MRKFLSLFLTLRGRLVLLVCLATLPAILFTFFVAHNERNSALNRMEEDARHIVDLISREHLYQMAGAKSLLRWLSDRLKTEEGETLVSDPAFLAALLAGYPQLANIAILAPDGEVISSAHPLSNPVNMHDYDAIQKALHSHAIEVGAYVIGPIVKRPLLHLTHAIRDGRDDIRWIVFVAIDLEWLKQLTEKVQLPSDQILLITDRDGRILAGSTTSENTGEDTGADTGADTVFSIGQAIPELAGATPPQDKVVSARLNDRSFSFVTTPMKDLEDILVVSALSRDRIYQKANYIFYRMLGILGLLTLFTVLSVLVVEELALLRAVRALSGATQRFGRGDYTARVSVPQGYGELKDMANAFNTMAETLTRRHKEVTEAHRRLDRLARHLQVARESEAQRISRDLHDEVGQVLTSIKMDLASFQDKCTHKKVSPGVDGMIRENIHAMRDKIDHAVTFIRRLASDLRPPVLDQIGLAAAIDRQARHLEDQAGVVVEVNIGGVPEKLPWLVSTTIYRIVQEALTNIARHARASEVHVTLQRLEDELLLTITDNGTGFACGEQEKETLGLIGMRERARLIGGVFSLDSAIGEGTTIRVTIPATSNGEEINAYPAG